MIIISLLFAAICIGLVWTIIFFPTRWLIPKKYLKNTRWIISLLLGSALFYFYFFTSPACNHEYALLKQKDGTYELTLAGERVYMSHDPISALSRETYIDTFVFSLPRKEGVIKGFEIKKDGGYPLLGSIEIENGQVTVKLFYDNYDDHVKDPLSCNGSYKLKK